MTAEPLVTTGDALWPDIVLKFWFDELGPKAWFVKDAAVDLRVKSRFATLYEDLRSRAQDLRAATAPSTLAAVIVLDQFPRNMFRDAAEAFATDSDALRLTKEALAHGLDCQLLPRQRQFLYMPFQHSENLEDQHRSVALYRALGLEDALDFAQRHKKVIEQFGRFPHRNAVLGRLSTANERDYLAQPGSGF